MKDELQTLRDEVQQRTEIAQEIIFEAATAGDMSRVAAVAAAVKELQQSLEALIETRRKNRKAMETFDQLTKSYGNKAAQTRPVIIIHWRALGVNREPERIDTSTGAEALSKFLEALVRVKGAAIMPVIATVISTGSALVSQRPQLDFINPVSGEVYGYRPIGSTGWHVKTHSSTKTKVEQIRQVQEVLSMPERSVQIETVAR